MSVVRPSQAEAVKEYIGTGSVNFIGMPYAGKDAHAQAIGEEIEAPVISGGQILREQRNLIPIEDALAMEAGELISSQTYTNLVLRYFSRNEYSGKPLMLSAVGRRDGEQLPTLDAAERSGHPIKQVVVVDIDFEDAKQRWEEAQTNGNRGQRADDTYEAFKNRFEWFEKFTVPVIDFYVEISLATRVDGRAPRPEVTEQILSALAELA